jgi:hypothetical protein
VQADAVLATLDVLGEEVGDLADDLGREPAGEVAALVQVLGEEHGFAGDRDQYDRPENSMLDVVLERRKGLPILLSVVFCEVARRAGIDVRGVGLPGHFVVGHFGATPPVLLDPFAGGAPVGDAPAAVEPWGALETGLRMLNNLVPAFEKRGDLASAIRAAELRLALPIDDGLRDGLVTELMMLRARLN